MSNKSNRTPLRKVQWQNVKFEWTKNHAQIISGLGFGKALNKKFADIVLQHADKYTPFSLDDYEGSNHHMAQMVYTTSNADEGKIIYTKPYAKVQYAPENYPNIYPSGIKHRTKAIHPLATSHWIEQCWSAEKPQIVRRVNKERKRLAK